MLNKHGLILAIAIMVLVGCTSQGSESYETSVDDQYWDYVAEDAKRNWDAEKSTWYDDYEFHEPDYYSEDPLGYGGDYYSEEGSEIYEPDYSEDSGYGNYDESLGCPYGCVYHKQGCEIKGNISFDTGEKIYHIPGSEFYAATNINPDFGEMWFCSEAEAKANGWRKSFE